MCCRAGLCRVREQREARIARKLKRLVGEVESPDDRVVKSFRSGAMEPDVMVGPPDTELLASGGQLTNQIGQSPVVGITAGFGTQHGHDVVGDAVPVVVEGMRPRVDEREAGVVRRADRVGE